MISLVPPRPATGGCCDKLPTLAALMSAAVMTADEADWASDFDTLKAKKTMAGSGGVVYLDEDTNMAFALANLMRFYAHES